MKVFLTALLAALLAFGAEAETVRIMASFEAPGLPIEGRLRNSLEAALATSDQAAALLRFEPGEEDLVAAASKASCLLALEASAAATEDGISVKWRFLASAGGTELRSGSFDKPEPSARDLVSSFWVELVQDLGPAIEALPVDNVIVAGPPGARVSGFGDPFVMPAEGEVQLPMRLPAFIRWKAGSKSYLDASGSLLVEPPKPRIELGMKKPPSWTAETALYGFSFPEARAALLLGKRLFARATITQFELGLSLQNGGSDPSGSSLFSSFSLIQAGLGFGAYLEDPDHALRFYAAADAFLRFAIPYGESFFIDPVAPLGLYPLIGAEWGKDAKAKLYLEFGGLIYPYARVDYMLASRGNSNGTLIGSVLWSPGGSEGLFWEFPIAALGLRMYF
jgi:hypothetical protein